MFCFSIPMYEMLAREMCDACPPGATLEEQVVELEWEERGLLFRFTPCREEDRLGFCRYRMETWCGGVKVSNDFDADRLRSLL